MGEGWEKGSRGGMGGRHRRRLRRSTDMAATAAFQAIRPTPRPPRLIATHLAAVAFLMQHGSRAGSHFRMHPN